jgi:hypothetical protein
VTTLRHRQSRFAFELNGNHAGILLAAEFPKPPEALASVPNTSTQTGGLPLEAYTSISLTFGAGMSQTFYDWVGACLHGHTARHAVVLVVDFDGKVRSRHEIVTGTMSEAIFPALSAGSHAPVGITLRFTARVRHVLASTSLPLWGTHLPKLWSASQFRLRTQSSDLPISAIGKTTVRPGRGVQLDVTAPAKHVQIFRGWHNGQVAGARLECLLPGFQPFAALGCRCLRLVHIANAATSTAPALPPHRVGSAILQIPMTLAMDGPTFHAA